MRGAPKGNGHEIETCDLGAGGTGHNCRLHPLAEPGLPTEGLGLRCRGTGGLDAGWEQSPVRVCAPRREIVSTRLHRRARAARQVHRPPREDRRHTVFGSVPRRSRVPGARARAQACNCRSPCNNRAERAREHARLHSRGRRFRALESAVRPASGRLSCRYHSSGAKNRAQRSANARAPSAVVMPCAWWIVSVPL
jgi:hypothetical protein